MGFVAIGLDVLARVVVRTQLSETTVEGPVTKGICRDMKVAFKKEMEPLGRGVHV